MDDSKNVSSEVVSHVDRTNDLHTEYNEHLPAPHRYSQNHRVQNIICFWVVGLCSGFGWTVMLSATYDILKRLDGVSVGM